MKAEDIFLAALNKQTPPERTEYLDEACGNDADLRAKVDALLRSDHEAGSFLDAPLFESPGTIDQPVTEKPGTVIGPYKLLQQIGEGGFGIVFMAVQTEPVRRRVALKVIKPGMDTRQVIARFEAERQALAVMDHPNIAKVLDAGATKSSRPYFVMELVRGVPITQYCDENSLSIRERLALFASVCQAIQHAHTKGIIHRDIKPSNVLVTRQDGQPVVKVIDFGIAKALGQQLTDKTLFTDFAQMIGTPLYMSPEQAELSSNDIDTRSDIYSLGVLLYELLTGSTPVSKEQLKAAAFDEIRRIIREDEPQKPSNRISTAEAAPSIAAQRHTEPARLARLMRGELDWIVMKALEKDRSRRYESATNFASDIDRYLADEPVLACPPSTAYRLRKFARRHKRTLVTLGVVTCAVIFTFATFGWAVRDRAARHQAETIKEAARQAQAQEGAARALGDAEQAYRLDDLPEAISAVKRAEVILGGTKGNSELERGVRNWRADLEFATSLEAMRLEKAGGGEKIGFDSTLSAALSYGKAFRQYGLDLDSLKEDDAVKQIRASNIKPSLVAALDDWTLAAEGAGKTKEKDNLLAIARRADDDPMRNRLREAFLRDDLQALSDLAREENMPAQPAPTILLLNRALTHLSFLERKNRTKPASEPASEAATQPTLDLALLGEAQRRHPDDFWINYYLAESLMQQQPPRASEAVGFYRVAVALRPRHSVLLSNLGVALLAAGQQADGEAECWKAVQLHPAYGISLAERLAQVRQLAVARRVSQEALRLRPDDPKSHLALAQVVGFQGEQAEKEAICRRAIERWPDNFQFHVALGESLVSQRRLVEAQAAYHEAVRVQPSEIDVHWRVALFYRSQDKRSEEAAEFREIIRLDPSQLLAYRELNNAFQSLGQIDEAIAFFRNAEFSSHPAIISQLAELLVENAEYAEAAAQYERLPSPRDAWSRAQALEQAGDWERAIQCYRHCAKANPGFHFRIAIGRLLYRRGRIDEAEDEFRAALLLNPNSAKSHYGLGVVLSKQQRPDEASTAWEQAIALEPNYAFLSGQKEPLNEGERLTFAQFCWRNDFALAAARTYQQVLKPPYKSRDHLLVPAACAAVLAGCGQGEDMETIDAQERARWRTQAHEWLRADVGIYQERAWDGMEKERNLRHWTGWSPLAPVSTKPALARLPEAERNTWRTLWAHVTAILQQNRHYRLGRDLRGQQKLPEAEFEFREAVRLDPTHWAGHYFLGDNLLAQSKLADAELSLREVVRLQPEFGYGHFYLGLALMRQSKMREAEGSFREAARLLSEVRQVHSSLASVLAAQDKVAEAESAYREAVHLEPGSASDQNGLGEACARLGKWSEASAAFTRFLELVPNNRRSAQRAALLRLVTEDIEGYHQACQIMVGRSGANGKHEFAGLAATTCLLSPGALKDAENVSKLIAEATGDSEESRLLMQGLMEFRGERYSAAAEVLQRFRGSFGSNTSRPMALCIIAMTQQRLGQQEEAQKSLASAELAIAKFLPDPTPEKPLGRGWPSWLMCQVLRREAAELINPNAVGGKQESRPDAPQ